MASLSYALTVTIAALITQFGHHKCETIDTYVASQFSNSIINCFSTENCTVICDEEDSCTLTNVYCPTNYSCDIHCTGPTMLSGVCAFTTVHCPTEAPCIIHCDADRACLDAQINWAPGQTGTISCNGEYSCDG
eukprot:320401_1